MKGYYQPSGLVGWVNLAWILMFALLALVMQLEVTHFNVWTALLLVGFIIIALITVYRRRVELAEDNQVLLVGQLGSVHMIKMPLNELKYVQFTKRGVVFHFDGENYAWWLSKKMRLQLQAQLKE